jgi:hypothetical protein
MCQSNGGRVVTISKYQLNYKLLNWMQDVLGETHVKDDDIDCGRSVMRMASIREDIAVESDVEGILSQSENRIGNFFAVSKEEGSRGQ